MADKKYRYNFQDRGKEKVYQSETPHSASTHVLSQYKPSKEDSPTAGHKDYSYNKKTGNVTFSHDREEDGVKVSGHKTIPATKEHEEELKNASKGIELEKTKASKMSRAFQHYSAAEDKKTAKEESEVHRVSRPSMLSGEVKNVSDKVVRVRPRQSEAMTLSKDLARDYNRNEAKKVEEDVNKYSEENPHKKYPHGKIAERFNVGVLAPKKKSIDDLCDDILCKYAGTGKYSGSGANDPVVTKREGYTVRERPLPGQTKESIKAGHIRSQKEESTKKLESHEKEKSKIRDEGYKLGQKNPASQYAPPAPPEKKYSGGWRDYFRRSEGNMDLKKSIDDLLEKCNSHVISSETEEGLKKKKKQAPRADGHTLGKNPPAKPEDLEMVKVDVEGAFKSSESDLMKSVNDLLEKAQLPGLNKPAVKQTAKVKTAEDTMSTEKPKNLIRSMDDLTTEKYIAKSVHLVKDLVKSEEKPIEFFHVPDETYKSQKTILGKWKTGNFLSIGGNRILNTAKDMASEGYTSLKKEDEDISREEVAGRKKMDREDVKSENKKARLEYSSGDEGAE